MDKLPDFSQKWSLITYLSKVSNFSEELSLIMDLGRLSNFPESVVSLGRFIEHIPEQVV